MRIITGTARGKRLQTPEGLHTRPTTDRVKESVFNIIQWDIEGRRVLDLFGGSGQLGLEAVSRGAESCVIVDGDRSAQKAIEANIKNCRFEKRCQLVKGDSFQFLQRQRKNSYHLIFLDPPYGKGLIEDALVLIDKLHLKREDGIIVAETGADTDLELPDVGLEIIKEKRYGKTKVLFLQ